MERWALKKKIDSRQ